MPFPICVAAKHPTRGPMRVLWPDNGQDLFTSYLGNSWVHNVGSALTVDAARFTHDKHGQELYEFEQREHLGGILKKHVRQWLRNPGRDDERYVIRVDFLSDDVPDRVRVLFPQNHPWRVAAEARAASGEQHV